MSRELKFRIWNPQYKEFSYWGFLNYCFVGISTGHGLSIGECLEGSQQFTNRHDKKGIEIYEGDIVTQGSHDMAEVFFCEGSFCTCINEVQWLEMSQNGFDFEVVGNIFQSPLLKYLKAYKGATQ